MSTPKDKSQRRRKAIYSEEFQEMLDRLEEEDNVDRGGHLSMRKSRLCLEKVKALEKHFEVENKLQPDRKLRIAKEVGLEPRQVAIWFQNRRARWKTKQLEREYDQLRANYDVLKHDYGSLEQEKQALLNQLESLKAKIEARNVQSSSMTTSSQPLQSTEASASSLYFRYDPVDPISSSSMSIDEFELCKDYQEEFIRMDEMGMLHSNESCNFFSVDQPPTLHWHQP